MNLRHQSRSHHPQGYSEADRNTQDMYRRCRALLMPGVEDTQPGTDDDVVDHLASVMRDFNPANYDRRAIAAEASAFSPESFRARIADAVLNVARQS